MVFSIKYKLLLSFLGLTALVLTATLLLARWSFNQGFLDYVNALELERLERLSDTLIDEYVGAGMQWSQESSKTLERLLQRPPPRSPRGGPPPARRPPHDRADEPPPPRAGKRSKPGRPDRLGPMAPETPPTGLYDQSGALIAGARVDDEQLSMRIPLEVNGEIVGELRSEPYRQFTTPLETAFLRQQFTTSWIIGLASLLLALVVSLLLARGLLAPVHRMIASVAELSRGNYAYREKVESEDELGQLTRDLNHLGVTLEANQSSRKRLLAEVSHELRTPLSILSGEIEALKDGVRNFDAQQLGSLDQEVQRLRFLVDDLYELSLSDLGGLRYTFADVDLYAMVRSTIAAVEWRAADAGLSLAFKSSVVAQSLTVRADTQRMDQLLHNLLENAIAYTDAPGSIAVELVQLASEAVLTVEDTAPGVSMADCERLLEPLFRKESSRSRRTGGAGLGLAICHNIVTAHGGQLATSPSPLGGLRISVTLPLTGAMSS